MEDGESSTLYGNGKMDNNIEDVSREILDFYSTYDLQIAGKIDNLTSFEIIEEMEKRFPVDSIMLPDKTRVWNLLRIFFYSNFQKQRVGRVMYLKSLKNLANIFKESLRNVKPPEGVEIYGFSGTENRRLKEGMFYDIYIDPLYDILGDKLGVFEWPTETGYRREYNAKVYSKNYVPISLPLKTLLAIGRDKLLNNDCDIKNKEILEEILRFFSKNTTVNYSSLRKGVYEFISTFYHVKKFLFEFLSKYRPKAVMIRCGYGRFHMALSQACKELNIPSVELQHGLITKYHIGYVKTMKSENRDCVPEYLLTYGDAFSEIVKKGNLFNSDKVVTVGFPYLEEITSSFATPEGEIKRFLNNFNKSILFTSQWILAEEIKRFVVELSRKLKNEMPNVGIVFKPHPNDPNNYSDIKCRNIFVADKYTDTYQILNSVDIHSTVYSTTGLESFAFGKPNIFIDIKQIYNKCGESYIVSTPREFIEKLKYIISDYDNASDEAKRLSGYFFKPNAKKNVGTFLKSIGIEVVEDGCK